MDTISPRVVGRRLWSIAIGLALVAGACSTDDGTGDLAAPDELSETTETSAQAEAEDTASPEDTESTEPPRGLSEAELADLDAAVDRYIEERSVASARGVVELIALSEDIRYAPWLVDLTQLGLSNLLGQEIIDVLVSMTGVQPTGDTFADFGSIGSLIDTQAIEPAQGYRRWKLALFERLDPEFRPLLDSVTDEDRFNRIRYGGVRRGGIPELNDPERITATEALEWITDDEIVLGIDLDGEVVAYPFRIIGHHELVNDTVGGIPVSAVYCTLCRTGLLFDRRVDGQVLDFQTSGMLINSNKIMVDRQTDTLWHHAAGLGIGGALEGTTLDVFPMETTTWAEWYREHPDTEVLEIPGPIFFDDPERPPITYPYEPGGPYSAYYEDPRTWFPIREVSDALDPKAEVIGINHGGGTLAVSVADIVSGPSRYFPVGDGAVVVAPNSRGARVYAAGPDALAGLAGLETGAEVVLVSADGESAQFTDGSVLDRIPVEQGFWFSWYDRHPTTEIWPAG